MIINSHAHIFNFKSQNTSQTRQTLINRLKNEGWPAFLVKAVSEVFDEVLKDEHIDEGQLLRKLLKALKASDHFNDYVSNLGGALPGEVGIIIHGNLDAMATHALRGLIRRLSKRLSQEDDIREADLEDMLDFLLIGMQPSIEDVANILMEQTPAEDAVIALMMDITKGESSDEKRFKKQVSDTSRAALAHPGRILPFFAVNPNRDNHLDLLKDAVERKGFLGVKLYPSLGYKVDSAAMRRVYQYCVNKSLPILTHCNPGGFYFKKADIQLAAPCEFTGVLQDYPALRICFAHFGGDDALVSAQSIDQIGGWTADILQLMRNHSNTYADISYHTNAMDGGEAEANYFTNMKALIDSAEFGDRILYGSDFQLVRMRAREENYRSYYEQNLQESRFKKIAEPNPAAYLGLPKDDGTGAAANIINFAQFLAEHRTEVGMIPLPWVSTLLRKETGESVGFVANPFGMDFTPRNPAHYHTAWFVALLHPPSVRQTLTMEKIGNMQIRDLPGWPLETEDPANRSQTFLGFAKEMRMFMEKPESSSGPGAQFEQGITGNKTQKQLKALFEKGSERAYKLGLLVDSLYKFPKEHMQI